MKQEEIEYYQNVHKLVKAFSKLFVDCPLCYYFFSLKEREHTVIYRSSFRGVTLRCTKCGFQFAFTYHKLINAVEVIRDERKKMGKDVKDLDSLIKNANSMYWRTDK